MMVKRKGVVMALAVCLMLICLCPVSASEVLPAEDLDPKADYTLTVTLCDGETAVPDIVVSIYRIAEIETEYGNVTYTFLVGDMDDSEMYASESAEISATLAQTVSGLGLIQYTKTADAEGKVLYDSIEAGMYLVVQESEAAYQFEPFMVSVPEACESETVLTWNQEVSCMPKVAEMTEDAVKTGDSLRPGMYLAGLAVSAVLILLIFKKRKDACV